MSLSTSSCITKRACERKYPVAEITETHKTTEVYIRDTVIQFMLPAVSYEDSVKLDSVSVSILESQTATSRAWLNNGKLHHRLVQKDTTFNIAINGAIKTIETKEHVNTTRTNQAPEEDTIIEKVLWPLLQLIITFIVLLLAMKAFSR